MGSTSNKAQKAAEAAEAQRQAQVKSTQAGIEALYADPKREAGIVDMVNATRQFLQGKLDQQYGDAGRQLKFAMARTGKTGGSVDVDKNRRLGRDYLDAGLGVERKAQTAGNAVRSADQQSKLGLFSMAAQGLDATTAARQAGEMRRVNLANARSDALQADVDNAFGGFADIYKRSKEQAGANQAEHYQYGTFYTPGGPGGGFG